MARNSQRSNTKTQSHFARIPSANIQRSVFDRSSGYKTTFDAGTLIPFFVDEVLPGDTMRLNTSFLARLATPIFPYMDNVFIDFHYFFVPNRLVWDNWEEFNGAQKDPGDSTDFLLPELDIAVWPGGFPELSLADYFGLPTKVGNTPQMPQALPFRAYNLIWNDWFRDENLQDSEPVETDDGPDATPFKLLKRGRRKDYFTSALPWPQKGPAVMLPIGGEAPVFGSEVLTGPGNWAYALKTQSSPVNPPYGAVLGTWSQIDASQTATAFSNFVNPASGSAWYNGGNSAMNVQTKDQSGGNTNLYADLSDATAATINQLREAFQLQRLFERDARGGTRYVEILLSHFGVVSPDFRLQRPEYLGGGSVPINVNPVAQTSETTADAPQGNLAAFATASRSGLGFNHSFVEHGHVIGLVSVRADMTYQQGMNKMWSRRTRFDFYWPTLAHLGEQAVLNKEIYQTGLVGDEAVFGYQERFAEYRFKPSLVTARFRSNAAQSLDSWHLAMDFDTLPTLAGMVEENPPIDRIIATPDEPQFIFDSYTHMKHARPMPTYSVPGLIDHF